MHTIVKSWDNPEENLMPIFLELNPQPHPEGGVEIRESSLEQVLQRCPGKKALVFPQEEYWLVLITHKMNFSQY